jgi:PAS domain S-box-containing protein
MTQTRDDELEGARARLAAIVENFEDAIVSKTLDGVVTSWNGAAERLFGYSAAEMIGQPINRLIPPELQSQEDDILRQLRRNERVERFETVRVRKNGERFDVSLTISPIRNRAGEVVGASKIAHDITQRRHTEQALREEAGALETLNRVGHAVAAQLELERAALMVSEVATQVSGADFGAFFYATDDGQKGVHWRNTASGAAWEAIASFPPARIRDLFAPGTGREGLVRCADLHHENSTWDANTSAALLRAHLAVRSVLAVPVTSAAGALIGGILVGHAQPNVFDERTDRLVSGIADQAAIAIENAGLFKQLANLAEERRQLLESERNARTESERLGHLKDEFLATLSHELRTPLNAIQGWATLLQQPNLSAEDQRRGAQTIERNVRAQVKIVDDLLDMSRIISGKIHLEVQPIRLEEVVNYAIDTVRASATAKEIRLTSLLDSSIGVVRGDPNRLQQVLWNIVSNAVKFTPRAGRVHVVLERVNSHVEISTEDSGIGIRSEFLPYVFDRFRQADPSANRQYGGLGLGLSIVKQLVELHGGSVRVKSPGENRGSTFIVSLPVSHVQREHPRQALNAITTDAIESIELPSLAGLSVLIVDDEPDGRALIARILEGRGASAVCAASAIEALDHLRSAHFDLLLSDIGMPVMDGYTLIRKVREFDVRRKSPITAIAVTAYARPADRQRSLLAGYQMHLSKPIEARELVAGIASLLHISTVSKI